MALKKASNTSTKDFDNVVEEIEAGEVRGLNDVEVEEDGYVHDVPLLAGYLDPTTGQRHMTFTYREMTGKDEEAINKPEVRANGGRMVNVLIERCVKSIGTLTKKELGTAKWSELVKNLYGGDLDYMAIKIRELSKGKEIEFTHQCPTCKTKLTSFVNTDEFDVKPFSGADTVPFELPRGYRDKKGVVHKTGTVRILNGLDREIILPQFKKNVAVATTLLITRLIKFDDGAFVTNDMVSDMSVRDREYLEKIIKECAFGVDTSVELTCDNCGAEISGEAGASNFL